MWALSSQKSAMRITLYWFAVISLYKIKQNQQNGPHSKKEPVINFIKLLHLYIMLIMFLWKKLNRHT